MEAEATDAGLSVMDVLGKVYDVATAEPLLTGTVGGILAWMVLWPLLKRIAAVPLAMGKAGAMPFTVAWLALVYMYRGARATFSKGAQMAGVARKRRATDSSTRYEDSHPGFLRTGYGPGPTLGAVKPGSSFEMAGITWTVIRLETATVKGKTRGFAVCWPEGTKASDEVGNWLRIGVHELG